MKLAKDEAVSRAKKVASLADAWIEMISTTISPKSFFASHPSRMRGLKYSVVGTVPYPCAKSHPSRMRGLKFQDAFRLNIKPFVASLADAWIEIHVLPVLTHQSDQVASLADAWIEISQSLGSNVPSSSRIPRGCVD